MFPRSGSRLKTTRFHLSTLLCSSRSQYIFCLVAYLFVCLSHLSWTEQSVCATTIPNPNHSHTTITPTHTTPTPAPHHPCNNPSPITIHKAQSAKLFYTFQMLARRHTFSYKSGLIVPTGPAKNIKSILSAMGKIRSLSGSVNLLKGIIHSLI